ncbi:dTMP kinase [Campylobacter sp. RM12327]|uniref:dTMP kinase n=1 Tax=Campylobacter sputorum TaxID=206 RepID=UPI000B796784|nr:MULTISPECIES: dTMP kinase [Campylobacter]ASM40275.1 dTMP kinase [Campylobacter sputorum]MBE7357456.1 dTMP kinase [Campylobacter sp. RM11302]MBF6668766.1 dTMP kinase [Campylobacter sp. RM12327]MBF6674688.1 dTMP kinase [Campylobacter sp. RM13538]MBF6675995.1 dTMP kinase [Campylobacter sp. RM12321]
MLVTIEGIDGVGKSTQISLLADIYKDAIITKEPGGTNFGNKIREFLLKNSGKISYKSELLLFLADRAQHYDEIIKPNKNKMIFSDRGFISGIAYAMANDPTLDIEKLIKFNEFVLDNDFGDKFIFLKANFDILENRLNLRNLDSIEKRGLEYLKRVEHYMEILFKNSKFDVLSIDSTLEIQTIHKQILEFIND